MQESYPTWWRGIATPPPAEWIYTFDYFTGEDTADEWGLAAAVFIAQTRRRTGAGPSFSELFALLLPDTAGLPGPFPPDLGPDERRLAISGFRGHATIEWRRRGMISFDKGITRSLRVGREFRRRSRLRQQQLDSSCPTRPNDESRPGVQARAEQVEDTMTTPDGLPSTLDGLMSRFAPGWPPVIEVSPGWYSLLGELDRALAAIAPDYVVEQVKSKFGALRVYASPSADPHAFSEEFQDTILAAEWRSVETCEECGQPAKQYVIRLWVSTLCERHADEVSRQDRP